jgi:hypothetical protein
MKIILLQYLEEPEVWSLFANILLTDLYPMAQGITRSLSR